jgi:Uncharacterized protein conserved in bacteria (DUF2330)
VEVLMRRLVCFLFLAFAIPRPAAADGGMFIPKPYAGAPQTVEVGAQRGLIWQKPDALELWIEPIYAWEGNGDGAWVIPLPALPEVAEGDAALLDDLDALTAPTFVSVCWEPDCRCDCGWFECITYGSSKSDNGADVADSRNAELHDVLVTTWASGQVGALDYQIISAQDGDSIVAWLDAEDYAVDEPASDTLSAMETGGLYFFIARVAESPEPGSSLAPVVFRFDPEIEPFYPVRLTAAVLAPRDILDVTLYLLSDEWLLPLDDELATLSLDEGISGDEASLRYAEALEERLAPLKDGGFVIEFADSLSERRVYGRASQTGPLDCETEQGVVVSCEDAWGRARCYEGGCGELPPIVMRSNLQALVREAETPFALRLRGRLPAVLRDAEWRFGGDTPEAKHLVREGAVYLDDRGDCWECPPCTGLFCDWAEGRRAPPGTIALLVLAALLATWGLRRARQRH